MNNSADRRPSRLPGWLLSVVLLVGFTAIPLGAGGQTPAPARLVPGMPTERSLASGESHAYELELGAGRRSVLRVDQRGIDVVVEVSDARGEVLVAVDGLLGREGAEALLLDPMPVGTYEVTVKSTLQGVPDGRYEIRIDTLAATARADAWRLPAELEALRLWTSATAVGEVATSEVERTADGRRRVEHLEVALEKWRLLDDHFAMARTWQLIGKLSERQGDYRRAVASYIEALELWRRSPDRASVAATLGDLGLAYRSLGESRQAIGYLEEALALRHDLGQRERESETRNQLCLIQQRLGQWSEAKTCYDEVLSAAKDAEDTELEARALNNLGGVHWNLGEPETALECYGRALSLRRGLGDAFGEAAALNNLGALYRGLGEIEEALVHYAPALEIFESLGNRYWQARTLNNVGVAYSSLGDLERARSFLMRALPLRRAVADASGEAVTLRGLGAVSARLGETPKAFVYYRKALESSETLGDRQGIATTQKLLGRAYLEAGEYEAARAVLEPSLEYLRELGKRQEQAQVLELLARSHLMGGRTIEAKALAGRSLRMHRGIRSLMGEVTALVTLARVERHAAILDPQRVVSALQHLDAAFASLDTLYGRLGDPAQRASFSASQRRAYELKIHLLMELHASAPDEEHDIHAFEVSERARSRALLGSLDLAKGGLAKGLGPALEERLRSAERRLAAQSRRHLNLSSKTQNSSEARAAEQDVHAALGALEAVRAEIRRLDPRAAQLAEPSSLGLRELQREIDPGTVLVEFLLGDEQSYVWAVTAKSIRSHVLPPRSEFESLAREAHRQLSIGGPSGAARGPLRALGRLLFPSMLLRDGPGESELVETPQRVAIVADGELQLVPFAALPMPGTGQPLVVSHEVVMVPSLSALAAQRSRRAERPPSGHGLREPTVAIFADPLFDQLDSRMAARREFGAIVAPPEASPIPSSGVRSAMDRLERLPHTRHEARAIAALLPPARRFLALGAQARRSLVLDGDLENFSILHFATHGFVDPRVPELSGLVLSRFDSERREINGFLGLHDVAHLELDADLVVLSGCQTALGKEVPGEGWIGLARGFSYAGVPRVVSSLWQVRDQATATLMHRFYEAMLTGGQSPAAALRTAQLEVRSERRYRDPYYWAAFALEGDWR